MGNVAGKENSKEVSLAGLRNGSTSSKRSRKAAKEVAAESDPRLVFDPNEKVDGGFFVMQGLYKTTKQDFKLKIVREFMIDRRMAPFYKGLTDYEPCWSDKQLLAAIRGLPIPDEEPEQEADAGPSQEIEYEDDEEMYKDDVQALAVICEQPTKEQLLASAQHNDESEPESDVSSSISDTKCSELNSATTSATSTAISISGKIRSASNSSSTSSLMDFPQIQSSSLPAGYQQSSNSAKSFSQNAADIPITQPSSSQRLRTISDLKREATHIENAEIEIGKMASRDRAHTSSAYVEKAGSIDYDVLLYRNSVECPICFLYYPPYINITRCCAQAICSECFVQIKRAPPHPPHDAGSSPESSGESASNLQLVSEPASCPFCQEQHFGITYSPSPFRSGVGASKCIRPADSSAPRSRGQSISHDAPGVITTDHIRPDWSHKLSTALASMARRSAAATALHSSAFMLSSPSSSGTTTPSGREKKGKRKNRLRGFSSDRKKDKSSSNGSASASRHSSATSSAYGSRVSLTNNTDQEVVNVLDALRLNGSQQASVQSRR